jgi:uncharacterized protein
MSDVFRRRIPPLLFRMIVAMAAASPAVAQDAGSAREGYSAVQALQVVDCLLPGQVRTVGGRTYLTPRRPARATAQDCGARGGEYLAYDRADYRSALNVWLPAAQEGDPEAQTMVGEIYERGAGAEPDYEAAAEWYRRAAEQGFARAQFDLGSLYESGLGVPVDKLEALNWFRRASGLPEDSLIFQSAAASEQAALRAELEAQIAQRDRQIDVLRRQIESLNEQIEDDAGDAAAAREELDSIRVLLAALESEQGEDRSRLGTIPSADAVRSAEALPAAGASPSAEALPSASARTAQLGSQSFEQPEESRYRRREFGRFYALIVGVEDYDLLDDLVSPVNDITQVAQMLEDRYGFSVVTLANPDQLSLMRAINQLNDRLQENDNLLIYFAGHGSRLQSGAHETGYWLPRNAEPSPDDTLWVPTEFVSRHLGRIGALRVLVISDSCYGGLLGDDPGYVMIGNGSYTDAYIEWKRPKRSRLVLSSGVDSPIVESPEHEHSVFAQALIGELSANEQVLTAPELFLRIRQRLRDSQTGSSRAPGAPLEEPQLKALKDAGHEVGDFFFIPTRS